MHPLVSHADFSHEFLKGKLGYATCATGNDWRKIIRGHKRLDTSVLRIIEDAVSLF